MGLKMVRLILQPQQFAPDLFRLGLYMKYFLFWNSLWRPGGLKLSDPPSAGLYTTMPGYNEEVLRKPLERKNYNQHTNESLKY